MRLDLNFRRESHKYVTQWFVPTALLTLVSFTSFWIKSKEIRLKFLLVTLVLLYLHTIYIKNQASTKVSFSTFIDHWLFACLMFVVAAVAELVVVRVVDGLTNQKNRKNDTENSNVDNKAAMVFFLI